MSLWCGVPRSDADHCPGILRVCFNVTKRGGETTLEDHIETKRRKCLYKPQRITLNAQHVILYHVTYRVSVMIISCSQTQCLHSACNT